MSSAKRDPSRPSFSYHAQSIGLAASLTKPSCEIIPGQAATSLSQTGGESYSSVKDFNWKGLITFDEASSYVTGSYEEMPKRAAADPIADDEEELSQEEKDAMANYDDVRIYNTLTTSTIRNLNIANMVQADFVVARITSTHRRGELEGKITFTGSMIRNLTIAGETVNVVLDPTPFSQFPKFDKFVENCTGRKAAANAQVGKDTATASLVSGEVSCRSGETTDGYVIRIKDFGTIYIAQVLMKRGYRSLNMLRFELGCPIGGTLAAAGGGTNGGDYFP